MVESDAFVSSLGKGREAFHSEVTEFSLRIGERTAEDFLRHFSCSKIMVSLGSRPLPLPLGRRSSCGWLRHVQPRRCQSSRPLRSP